MRRIIPFLCAAFVIGWVTASSGATIQDLYGDMDGFGIDVKENATFDWKDLPLGFQGVDQTDFFTVRNDLPLSWTHTYSMSDVGMIRGATLEIFSGGQGTYGHSKVFLESQQVGTLTDGDSGNINYARKDVIDLLPYVHLLDGNDLIRVETCNGPQDAVDNWVLDYSLLKITYESINAPVPPSIVLLGSGLIGLITLGRKRLQFHPLIHRGK